MENNNIEITEKNKELLIKSKMIHINYENGDMKQYKRKGKSWISRMQFNGKYEWSSYRDVLSFLSNMNGLELVMSDNKEVYGKISEVFDNYNLVYSVKDIIPLKIS